MEAGTEVLELRVTVGGERTDGSRAGPRRPGTRLRCKGDDNGRRPLLFHSIEHGVADLGQGLIPGDLLPLPLAAFAGALQWAGDTILGVVQVTPGGALLAAHRVHVGSALVDERQAARLLLADDLAVPSVDPERTASRVAVDGVAAPGHLVPLPLVAIRVGPGAGELFVLL